MRCPILARFNKFTQAESLGLYAIAGYLWFLLIPTKPDLSTFFLVALGLAALLAKNGLRPRLGRMDYPVLSLFVAAACLATVFSDEPARSARYLVYLLSNIFLLALVASITSISRVRVILASLMFLGSLQLLAILISSAVLGPASPEEIIDYQPFVILLVPNDVLIAGLCLPASIVVLWQMNKQWKPASLFIITAYFASAVYASYLLQSKVGMISLLAALLAMAVGWKGFAQAGQRSGHLALRGIALAAVLILLASGAFYLGNQSTTRLGLWSYAVSQHSAAEVWVGTGPNTFSYDPTAVETPFEEEGRTIPWTHNLFLESYTEQGLFGLVGILAISVIPVMRAIRIENPALRSFLFASALTFFLLGLLEITLTRRFYFAYLALIYGLSCSPALRR